MDWRYDLGGLNESMNILIPRHTGGILFDMETHGSNDLITDETIFEFYHLKAIHPLFVFSQHRLSVNSAMPSMPLSHLCSNFSGVDRRI
jgi:hypothetical protein